MKSVIPSFITGTPEERIENWKAYVDNGITLIDSSDDKNWIEYGDLSYEDFERCGFSFRYNMGTWDVYTKVKVDVDVRTYIKYDNDNKRLVVIADNDKTLFDGIIKTNYEFYQLMRQLNIIDSDPELEPEIGEEPKPELNAETGNIYCSDELIGIATLGGPISVTSTESYCTSCTISLYDSFLIDTIVKENSIELVYKEVSIWNGLDKRVYKIVYSCLDGKWHKSDRIYGEIIPEQVIEETYKF